MSRGSGIPNNVHGVCISWHCSFALQNARKRKESEIFSTKIHVTICYCCIDGADQWSEDTCYIFVVYSAIIYHGMDYTLSYS